MRRLSIQPRTDPVPGAGCRATALRIASNQDIRRAIYRSFRAKSHAAVSANRHFVSKQMGKISIP